VGRDPQWERCEWAHREIRTVPASHRPPRWLVPLLLRYQRLGLFSDCIRRRCSAIHASASASVANGPETAADEVRETDRERLQKAFPEIGIAIRD